MHQHLIYARITMEMGGWCNFSLVAASRQHMPWSFLFWFSIKRISLVRSWRKRHLLRQPISQSWSNTSATKHLNSIHLITCHYNPIKTPNVPQTRSKLLPQTVNQGQTLLLLPTTELHSTTVITGVIFRAWKRCQIRR